MGRIGESAKNLGWVEEREYSLILLPKFSEKNYFGPGIPLS